MRCTVPNCESEATLTSPLPLCTLDAMRVAAAHMRAVDVEAPMTRMMALVEIHASPDASDAELSTRTGWPMDWVTSHRRSR